MLTRDKAAELANLHAELKRTNNLFNDKINAKISQIQGEIRDISQKTVVKITTVLNKLESYRQILEQLSPENVLARGYCLVRGKIALGKTIEITTIKNQITAEVKNVSSRIN
jgi:exonuclease VII large subunit